MGINTTRHLLSGMIVACFPSCYPFWNQHQEFLYIQCRSSKLTVTNKKSIRPCYSLCVPHVLDSWPVSNSKTCYSTYKNYSRSVQTDSVKNNCSQLWCECAFNFWYVLELLLFKADTSLITSLVVRRTKAFVPLTLRIVWIQDTRIFLYRFKVVCAFLNQPNTNNFLYHSTSQFNYLFYTNNHFRTWRTKNRVLLFLSYWQNLVEIENVRKNIAALKRIRPSVPYM